MEHVHRGLLYAVQLYDTLAEWSLKWQIDRYLVEGKRPTSILLLSHHHPTIEHLNFLAEECHRLGIAGCTVMSDAHIEFQSDVVKVERYDFETFAQRLETMTDKLTKLPGQPIDLVISTQRVLNLEGLDGSVLGFTEFCHVPDEGFISLRIWLYALSQWGHLPSLLKTTSTNGVKFSHFDEIASCSFAILATGACSRYSQRIPNISSTSARPEYSQFSALTSVVNRDVHALDFVSARYHLQSARRRKAERDAVIRRTRGLTDEEISFWMETSDIALQHMRNFDAILGIDTPSDEDLRFEESYSEESPLPKKLKRPREHEYDRRGKWKQPKKDDLRFPSIESESEGEDEYEDEDEYESLADFEEPKFVDVLKPDTENPPISEKYESLIVPTTIYSFKSVDTSNALKSIYGSLKDIEALFLANQTWDKICGPHIAHFFTLAQSYLQIEPVLAKEFPSIHKNLWTRTISLIFNF